MSVRAWRVVVAALWVIVLGSSLGVVYAKHEARNRFNELQRLTRGRDELDIEWGQLQLEQSTWATHGRIEKLARDRLHMQLPPEGQVLVVEPQS